MGKLTTRKIASLRKPGHYGDGAGLWLQIRRKGAMPNWALRYMLNGRARTLGLGPLDSVSLAEARELAREARRLLKVERSDPIEVRRAAQAAAKVESLKAMTFRQAAEQFLGTAKIEALKSDKHRKQWRSTLQRAFPVMGDLPLRQIDTAIVLKALLPIWQRTPETGSRLRGRIERVFAWALAHKLYEGGNPATLDVLRDALPAKPKAQHHKAIPYMQMHSFMAELRQRDSLSARALEFCILTATRTSETIGATWSEFDLDAGLWIIPASRMKANRDHRVPLSPRAVEILRQLRVSRNRTGSVFALSNMAMLELVRGMAGNGYTVHGFRSAFSDWARDSTAYSRDTVEMALAHSIKDKSEAAYRRGDALDKRRRLMAEWARYCESPATGAVIHSIGERRSA